MSAAVTPLAESNNNDDLEPVITSQEMARSLETGLDQLVRQVYGSPNGTRFYLTSSRVSTLLKEM